METNSVCWVVPKKHYFFPPESKMQYRNEEADNEALKMAVYDSFVNMPVSSYEFHLIWQHYCDFKLSLLGT